MAAGDVNSREINNVGSLSMITGTLEAANGTAVALLSTKSYILFAVVQNGDDEEGARVRLNHNGTVATNGTIHVTSTASDVDTWNYMCLYR